jgi:GMP synthase-like glutamine amidotransferase
MKNYCVVQHTYSEFLGLIESQLEKRDIGFSYHRPFVGQDMPGSAAQFDGLWLLGGAWPLAGSEHNPQVADELALIDVFRRSRRPVIGLGMGGLLVALQAGGTAQAKPDTGPSSSRRTGRRLGKATHWPRRWTGAGYSC